MLGLIFATFFGGAFRTLLRSDRVHERIVSELKTRFPKHEFQIGGTEVLLARGLWPGFGLKLHGVVFKQDVCGKLSFTLTLPEAVLPLDFFGLRKGKIRMKDVEITGGEIHLDYHACPPPVESVMGAAKSAAVAGPSHNSITPPKLEWEKVAQVLDGLVIHNFTITYEKNPTWKLLVQNAFVSLSDEMSAQASVEVQKSLPFGQLTHPVSFDVHADRRVMLWSVLAGLKEGSVKISGQVDAETQGARATVELRQLPIKDFMSEAYQMGFVDYDLKLKSTWLSCHLSWEGVLQNYAATPVQLRDCRTEGGYGRVEVSQAEFWLNTPEFFRAPVRMKVMQLQMQPVMEGFNRQVLPAVISQMGVWSGQVDFKSHSSWQLDGDLEGAEIVFANQSLHGKQVIDRLHTRASQKNGVVSARIDEIKLREGEFIGDLSGELSGDGRDGSVSVRVQKLVLAPSIQRLLVGGTIGPVFVEGAGTLTGGELSQWHGVFSLPAVQGEGWSAMGLQLRSTFRSGSFAFDGSVKSANVNGSWSLYPQLRTVMSELPVSVSWRNLESRVEIQKTGGTVHSMSALQENGAIWRVKGSWVRDREFAGALTVLLGKGQQNYNLRGERGRLQIQDKL